MIAIKNIYKSLRLIDFESENVEEVVVEFNHNLINILLITLYFPRNNNFDIFSHFKKRFEKIGNQTNKYTVTLVLGDFNENFLINCEGILLNKAKQISILFFSFGFEQRINLEINPTNSRSIYGKSLLNLFFTKIII